LFTDKLKWLAYVPAYLMACNQSLAYWSPAGLETAAFTFLVTLCLYQFLIRSRFLPASLMLAVWVRPEGALVAGILIIIEATLERKTPHYSIRAAVIAFVLSLPWLGFKLYYYGSIIPNPFYAKTGLSVEQVKDGLSYVGQFFRDYGFLGITWLIPLIFFRKLSNAVKAVWLFCVLYTLYLVLVGGDVLKVHRFCLPIFGGSAILAAVSLSALLTQLGSWKKIVGAGVITAALMGLTWYVPRLDVEYFNQMEKGLIIKMSYLAGQMQVYDTSQFSVASTTIGALGFYLRGHDVIDMLGLVDSTVARHPEAKVESLASTWKESRFNSQYVLSKAPDYVIFSTGQKPSAPAEQALMLYPQFLRSYRLVTWQYAAGAGSMEEVLNTVFKKMRPVQYPVTRSLPPEWVTKYKLGLEKYGSQDFDGAINTFMQVLDIKGSPVYPEMLYFMAECYARTQRTGYAYAILDSVLAMDSLTAIAQNELYLKESLVGDSAKARVHKEWVKKLTPWEMPRLDSLMRVYRAQGKTR
jgi:hypothetical protein